MRNTSNVDLKFFMEDSQNDEAFYATLDDQDSINSENMTTYPKSNTKSDEVCQVYLYFLACFELDLIFSERHANVLLGTKQCILQ